MLKGRFFFAKMAKNNQVCSFYIKNNNDINIASSLAHDLEIHLNKDETRKADEWSDLRENLYDLAVGRCTRTRIEIGLEQYNWLSQEMQNGLFTPKTIRVVSEAVNNITAEFNKVTTELVE